MNTDALWAFCATLLNASACTVNAPIAAPRDAGGRALENGADAREHETENPDRDAEHSDDVATNRVSSSALYVTGEIGATASEHTESGEAQFETQFVINVMRSVVDGT